MTDVAELCQIITMEWSNGVMEYWKVARQQTTDTLALGNGLFATKMVG